MATKFPPPRPEPHNQNRSQAVLVPIPQPFSNLNSIDTNVFYGNRTNSSSPTTAPSNQASNTIRETVIRNSKTAKSSATSPGPGPDQHPTSRNLKRPGPRRAPIAQRPLSFPTPVSCTKQSYTVKYKLRILSYLQHGEIRCGPTKTRKPTLKETAKRFQIPVANISRWKHEESKLLKMSGGQNRSRPPTRKWPKMESRLYAKFREYSDKGKIVRRGFFCKEGRAIFVEEYPQEGLFRFSNGWFTGKIHVPSISSFIYS